MSQRGSRDRAITDLPGSSGREDGVPVLTRLWSSLSRTQSTWQGLENDIEMTDNATEGEDQRSRLSIYYSRPAAAAKESAPANAGLGMMSGVFIPTLNSIFGVEVFLRWCWATGQGGISHALGCLVFGSSIAVLTTISISAISTNEVVKSGGAYYMIARSLGPAFGGAMGLLFYVALSFSVGSNTLGFAETVCDYANCAFLPVTGLWDWNQILVAFCAVVSCVILTLLGNRLFSSLSTIILAICVIALLFVIMCAWVQPVTPSLLAVGYVGPSASTFRANFLPDYDDGISFTTIFGVVYPSMTAILIGANMSGALANPGTAIPGGTLLAVVCMIAMYAMIIMIVGGTVDRAFSKENFYILQAISKAPVIVFIGTLVATYSSGYSSLVSASQVFQSMNHDNIFGTRMSWFGVEKGRRERLPRRAIMLGFCVGSIVLLFGDVNTIAPFLSNFMLMTFAALNCAAMVLDLSRTPNYRPTFKGSNWMLSLAGAIMCLAAMFTLDYIKAAVSVAFLIILFIVLSKYPPKNNWGSPSQAVLYRVAMAYIMRLDFRSTRIKYWRPQVVVLVKDPLNDDGLVQLASSCKKKGLLVVGHVMVGTAAGLGGAKKDLLVEATRVLRDQRHINGFVEVCVASSLHAGALSLVQVSGLGCLKPNTVVIGLPSRVDFSVPSECGSVLDWWTSVQETMQLRLNCIVAIGFKDYKREVSVPAPPKKGLFERMMPQRKNAVVAAGSTKPTIDVWLSGVGEYEEKYELFAARTMVVLQLAYLFSLSKFWADRATLRVMLLLPGETTADVQPMLAEFRDMMAKARLSVPVAELCTGEAALVMRELGIRPHRSGAPRTSPVTVAAARHVVSPDEVKVVPPRLSISSTSSSSASAFAIVAQAVTAGASVHPPAPSIPGFPTARVVTTTVRPSFDNTANISININNPELEEDEDNSIPPCTQYHSEVFDAPSPVHGGAGAGGGAGGQPVPPSYPPPPNMVNRNVRNSTSTDGGGGNGGGVVFDDSPPPVWKDFDFVSLADRVRVLNVLMKRHSKRAAVIFIQPAVSSLAYKSGLRGASAFIAQQRLLCEGLCPVALVMPNDSQVDERIG